MRSRVRERIVVAAVAALIALAIGETGLRLLWHNPYRHESPDHLVRLKKHHPNADHTYSRALLSGKDERIRLRTDDRSYILPSLQYGDPDFTIAFLGGSTTECLAVREDLRFPALVSELLSVDGLKINTLNVARSGSNMHDCINVLLNHVVADRPDMAVLMEGSNDVGYLRHDGDYRRSMGHAATIRDLAKWLFQMASARSYTVGLARKSAMRVSLQPENPSTDWRQSATPLDSVRAELYRQRVRAFVHICRDFGIVPVLMTQPFSDQRTPLTPAWLDATAQDQFNEIVREVGGAEGVEVVDLVRYLQGEVPGWKEPNRIFYDAIHVTDNGSQVYARHIADRLRPLISDGRQRPSCE